MVFWITTAVLAIMLASLAGVIVVWTGLGRWVEKNLGFLTSFAAGVFLVVSGRLIMHTIERTPEVWLAGIYILGGALLVLALFWLVPLFHHHHHGEADHTHHRIDIRRILFGDALHNIGDGLLLAIAFSTSAVTGVLAAIGIFFHEVVQEISEFFVLKQGGLSTNQALLTNFAISGTMIIGVVIGLVATSISTSLTPILLGVTAGSFLVVVGHDLIPHSVRASKKNHSYIQHISWFLLGAILMIAIMLIVGESHGH